MAIGIPRQARRPTVPRALIMVVLPGRIFVELLSTPARVIDLSVVKERMSLKVGASFAVYQGMSPSQYSDTEVLGVPPLKISIESLRTPTPHPSGISPNSESTSRSGNRSHSSGSR